MGLFRTNPVNRMAQEGDVRSLVAVLVHDRDIKNRDKARMAIAKLGGTAVPRLLALLGDDDLRYGAATALMIVDHFGSPVLPSLRAMATSGDPTKETNSLVALYTFASEGEPTSGAVIERLKRDGDSADGQTDCSGDVRPVDQQSDRQSVSEAVVNLWACPRTSDTTLKTSCVWQRKVTGMGLFGKRDKGRSQRDLDHRFHHRLCVDSHHNLGCLV